MLANCLEVSKIIASPPNRENILCEFCGKIFQDYVEHYVCNCTKTMVERETYWEIINNTQDLDVACYLHNISDDKLVDIMLGGPCSMFTELDSHIELLVTCINFLCKLSQNVQIF